MLNWNINWNVGSVSAPAFLWLGCLVLFILFLYFLINLRSEAAILIKRFDSLTKELLQIPPEAKPLDGVGLEQLRSVMHKDQVLSEFWDEFEETLLFDDNNGGVSKVYNTRQAGEFFREDALIATKLNLRLYSSLPGIFTSLGLLLTFIAILFGLSHIHPDAQHKLTGVEELVYSLSGKFISSICALILATLFTFFEKHFVKHIHRSYQQFIGAFNRRFARMPAEHLLKDIRQDISQQSIAFRQFGTDLSGHLKESFREGMDPLIQRIAHALEELAKQKSESLESSLGGIIHEFKSSLMGSTNNEFKALSDALGQTVTLLSQMNQSGQKSQESMSEMMGAFDRLILRQSSTGQENITTLSNTMGIVLEKLRDQTASSSSSFAETVTGVLQRLEQGTANQMSEASRRTEELVTLIRAAVQQMQSAMSESSSTTQNTVNGIIEKTSTWSQNTADSLAGVIAEQSRNATAISEARSLLGESLTVFKESVREGASTLRQLDLSSKSMGEGLIAINASVSKVLSIQEHLNDLAGLVDRNAQNLTQVITQQTQVLSSYEKVFGEFDKGIGSLLSQISSSLESYSARVKTSIETSLKQFDNVLGDATNKLGNTVEQLNESLEEIVDLAMKAKEVGNG